MRQRDFSKHRIMQVFIKKRRDLEEQLCIPGLTKTGPEFFEAVKRMKSSEYKKLAKQKVALTSREICELTGLKRRTVSPCLGELVSNKVLECSRAKDGKTKIYKPQNPDEYREPIKIYGTHRRRQLERLKGLGLHPIGISRPRGRPRKHIYPIEDSIKQTEILYELPDGALRRIQRDTGMGFKQGIDKAGRSYRIFSYGGMSHFKKKDPRRKQMEKAIKMAVKDFKYRQKLQGDKWAARR